MSCIVHINGWPGSGKRTIGRLLAGKLHGRLIDNHVMLNPAEALFVRSDPLHGSLWRAVRQATLEHAAELDRDVPLIFTDALADDDEDTQLFAEIEGLAVKRGVPLVAVLLEVSLEENLRRLSTPSRRDLHKLTRPDVLEQMRRQHRLLRPNGAISIEVSLLTAAEAAAALGDRIRTNSPE